MNSVTEVGWIIIGVICAISAVAVGYIVGYDMGVRDREGGEGQ